MRFGGFTAVDAVDLDVAEGRITGLIGPNGAGKSTFFNCLAGDYRPSAGSIRFAGREIAGLTPESHARLGMARTYQVPHTFTDMSVGDNVMVGAFLRHRRTADARRAADAVLERTGLAGQARHRASSLGTAGRKRLEIARALATEPKVLLLDEALAGLTATEIQAAITLVRDIHRSGITIVIVEHIMEVILSLADRVTVFHHGRIISQGTPGEVTGDPKVVEAYLGRSLERQRQRAAEASG